MNHERQPQTECSAAEPLFSQVNPSCEVSAAELTQGDGPLPTMVTPPSRPVSLSIEAILSRVLGMEQGIERQVEMENVFFAAILLTGKE